jgi:5-methylcytosine-specific restriction endonuclease McrA
MAVERITGRKLQALRLRIWSADPHCAMCGKLTAHPSGYELDHKIALTNQGTNENSNLQVLCHDCHEIKTNDDLGYVPRTVTGADGWPVEQTQEQKRAARWRRARGRGG